MFDQSSKGNTDITLVVFPNLAEFLAVDTRDKLPGRPMLHSLDLADVAGPGFADSLEDGFNRIVRDREAGFVGLMGIPGKVEELARNQMMSNMMDLITQDTEQPAKGESTSVGVLFFTGALLRIDGEQVRELANDLFGERLPAGLMNDLSEMIVDLMTKQSEAESRSTKMSLGGMISGKGGPYATLWERRKD